ncbi:MAG: hypothetical protein ACOC5D_00125 [Thermoplasmatota archaeon]
MTDEGKVGIVDRFKGFFNERPITPSERADRFITRKLPDYIEEYRLATKSDLKGIDKKIEEFTSDVSSLKNWKDDTKERHLKLKKQIERLEKQHDLEVD